MQNFKKQHSAQILSSLFSVREIFNTYSEALMTGPYPTKV